MEALEDTTDAVHRSSTAAAAGKISLSPGSGAGRHTGANGDEDEEDEEDDELFDAFGFRRHSATQEEISLTQSQAKRIAEQELKFSKLHAKVKSHALAVPTIPVQRQAIPAQHTKTFKTLIRHGVPPERRREMWLEMSGVRELMQSHTGVYTELLRDNVGKSSAAIKQIALDLPRTFPTNAFFSAGGRWRQLPILSCGGWHQGWARHGAPPARARGV